MIIPAEQTAKCLVMRVQQSDADCKLFSVWGILPGRSHVGADCLRSSSSLWQQPGEVCCTHIHTLCNAAPRAEESSSRVILPLSNRVCSFSKRVSTGVSCSFGREANSLGRKLATKEFTGLGFRGQVLGQLQALASTCMPPFQPYRFRV